jgi:cell division protein FtsW
MKRKKIDSFFLFLVIGLVLVGFFIFSSAALGQLTKDGASFLTVVSKQFVILLVGFLLMLLVSQLDYKLWRRYATILFVVALGLSLLVLIPRFSLEAGGARRWLNVGPLSFQPAEFLKFAMVIYLAAWLATQKDRVKKIATGLGPFIALIAVLGAILIYVQKDNGTFLVAALTATIMFFIGGGKLRHLLLLALIGIIGISAVAYARPYVRERLATFLDPSRDTLGASYQINQSLIAIGSGQSSGRGFGQSVQKFNFLPEPIGDSIFAVASEEFGFIGASSLILLFLIFALWGYKLALKITDPFGRSLTVGFISLIVVQSFINIGAMLGLIPLTGVPLLFVSHGGTALLFSLLEAGIILNISKYRA